MTQGSWINEASDAVLRLEFAKGTSASCIAALFFDVTRNAVIGRLHRLGLRRERSSRRHRVFRNTEPSPRRPVSTPGDEVVAGLVDITPLPIDPAPRDRVSLEQLTEETCRWPLGDPLDEDFGFCGCKPHPCFPYCVPHARVAYESIHQRRKRSELNGKAAANATTGAWR